MVGCESRRGRPAARTRQEKFPAGESERSRGGYGGNGGTIPLPLRRRESRDRRSSEFRLKSGWPPLPFPRDADAGPVTLSCSSSSDPLRMRFRGVGDGGGGGLGGWAADNGLKNEAAAMLSPDAVPGGGPPPPPPPHVAPEARLWGRDPSCDDEASPSAVAAPAWFRGAPPACTSYLISDDRGGGIGGDGARGEASATTPSTETLRLLPRPSRDASPTHLPGMAFAYLGERRRGPLPPPRVVFRGPPPCSLFEFAASLCLVVSPPLPPPTAAMTAFAYGCVAPRALFPPRVTLRGAPSLVVGGQGSESTS